MDMESSSVSPNKQLRFLALLLLIFAPLQQLQARELGGSTQAQHVGGVPSVLVLPTSGGDEEDDGAAVVPPKLNVLPAGVSRPGGLAPPVPQPGYRPQPGHHEPLQDVVVSSPGGVTGKQKLAPPPPAGNPPPHYRRLGPVADLLRLRVFGVMSSLLTELLNRSLKT